MYIALAVNEEELFAYRLVDKQLSWRQLYDMADNDEAKKRLDTYTILLLLPLDDADYIESVLEALGVSSEVIDEFAIYMANQLSLLLSKSVLKVIRTAIDKPANEATE